MASGVGATAKRLIHKAAQAIGVEPETPKRRRKKTTARKATARKATAKKSASKKRTTKRKAKR